MVFCRSVRLSLTVAFMVGVVSAVNEAFLEDGAHARRRFVEHDGVAHGRRDVAGPVAVLGVRVFVPSAPANFHALVVA